MQEYTINLLVDGEQTTANWSGYDEQVAIAQCFLYHAQNGARKLEVLNITLK